MFTIHKISAAAAALAVLSTPLIVRADTAKATLVYNFTYSSNQTVTARDSSDSVESVNTQTDALGGGTNGISHYQGSLNDKGTMDVQILSQQSDGGVVVSISENGENTRRASAATCVVYGNTQVICDPNKTVYTEEYTLLRFLGSNFVDPNQLDANKHWSISQTSASGSVNSDYTINSNNNGVMQIGEARKVRDAHGGSLTTDVQSKIGYDFNRTVPTTVDEYVTQRHDNGVQGTSTTIYQTTLQLVSDTMAKS